MNESSVSSIEPDFFVARMSTLLAVLALGVACLALPGCAVVGNAVETSAEVKFTEAPAGALAAVRKSRQVTLLYNTVLDTSFAEELERGARYQVNIDRSIQAPGQMTGSERRAKLPAFCSKGVGAVLNIRENAAASDNNGAAMFAGVIFGRAIVNMGFEIDVLDCDGRQGYMLNGIGKLNAGTFQAGNEAAIRRLGGSTLGKELIRIVEGAR